jgi:hypothetical protein
MDVFINRSTGFGAIILTLPHFDKDFNNISKPERDKCTMFEETRYGSN